MALAKAVLHRRAAVTYIIVGFVRVGRSHASPPNTSDANPSKVIACIAASADRLDMAGAWLGTG